MSYETWHDYGVGFKVENVETTLSRILDLVACAPDFQQQFESEIGDTVANLKTNTEMTVKDINKMMLELDTKASYGVIFAAVVSELEDIRLECVDDINGNHYVIFPQRLPWCYYFKERNMSEEKIQEIFTKYLQYLTRQPLEEIGYGYQQIENGG